MRAAALHVLGDLLASVGKEYYTSRGKRVMLTDAFRGIGVLISSVVLLFKPTYTIVDPICTFVFALIVLYTTFHLITDSVGVLMEGAPGHLKPEAIVKSLTAIPGVIAVHDLHVWTLSPGKPSLTAHILVEKDVQLQYDDILYKSQRVVCDEFGVHHTTLQIESEEARFTSHCRPEICCARV